MIERYNSTITVINGLKNKMLCLKFKIENEKLYAYNMFLPEENRKMLEVSKINGVYVANFLEGIEQNDLYDINKMKSYGIDTTDNFICTFIDGETNIDFDILSEDSKDGIFYKKHENNSIVPDNLSEMIQETTMSDNIMLEYASTNAKALLSMLKNMSMSEKDKTSLNLLLQQFISVDDNYANVSNNLDMIFLSTQLLMLDDKLDFVPEYIENLMSRVLVFNFGTNELDESNNAILTEGQVDYKKIIKMIRNCIAHSNYKVLEDGNIEFYNEGKNKMNFTINKMDVISLFDHLYNYYFLNGCLPVIINGNYDFDRNSFTTESLLDYLRNIELLGTNLPELKRFDSEHEQRKMDDDLGLNIYNFNSSRISGKESVLRRYEYTIKKHLRDEPPLNSKRLSEEDIQYILNNINEMNSDYFYQLGKSAQIEVINQLIIKKYNKDYYLHANLQDIINSNHFNNQSLVEQSSDYINYKTKIELLMLSLTNNLLLFCYNQNKSIIETEYIRFPKQIYIDYLESRKNSFYETSKEASDYQFAYTSLLKASSSHLISYEDFKIIEDSINKTKNKLIKTKNDIASVDAILEGTATNIDYKNINIQILNRMRDCLAHGRLSVEVSDINNIMETQLKIIDEYEGKLQFSSSLSFGELIEVLNQPDFIKSLLNDNQNFKKHSK